MCLIAKHRVELKRKLKLQASANTQLRSDCLLCRPFAQCDLWGGNRRSEVFVTDPWCPCLMGFFWLSTCLKNDDNKWRLQYEPLWGGNWRIISFHLLRNSELSPLLASQTEYFLTHNEKASHLSGKHILFTAHVGLLWHSIQTQFHHVKLIMPKRNHWNSQATALLSLLPHETLHLFLRAVSEWQDHRTHLWERQIKG